MFGKRSTIRELEKQNKVLLHELDKFGSTRLHIYFDDNSLPSFDASLRELYDTARNGINLLHFKYSETGIDRGAPLEQSEPYKGI